MRLSRSPGDSPEISNLPRAPRGVQLFQQGDHDAEYEGEQEQESDEGNFHLGSLVKPAPQFQHALSLLGYMRPHR